jgi:MoxR-like ATPase
LLVNPNLASFASIDDVTKRFAMSDYVCKRETATVVFLMTLLQRPLLVEGPPGVGKTELAKILAETADHQLIRL